MDHQSLMKMCRRSSRRGLFAGLLVLALLLAACGAGDDGSDADLEEAAGDADADVVASDVAASDDESDVVASDVATSDDATDVAASDDDTDVDAASSVTNIAFASPEEANDFGWNQQGLEAAEEVAEEVGAELEVADGIGYTDVAPALRQLASDEPDLLIAHASGYRNVGPEVAEEFQIPTLFFNNAEATTPGIAADIDNKPQEGGYAAGGLAARMTQTGTLGLAQSADVSSWNRQSGGFIQGARSVDPDITIRLAVIGEGGFADVAGGRRITEQLIGAGADIIFGMGDGSSFGMIQGVEGATPPEGADQVWFIDVIGDKTELDEQGVYLSSVLWDFAPIFRAAVADIEAGTFGEQGYEVSVANEAIKILRTDHIPDDVWTEVEGTLSDISAGAIEVDDLTTLDEVQALIEG